MSAIRAAFIEAIHSEGHELKINCDSRGVSLILNAVASIFEERLLLAHNRRQKQHQLHLFLQWWIIWLCPFALHSGAVMLLSLVLLLMSQSEIYFLKNVWVMICRSFLAADSKSVMVRSRVDSFMCSAWIIFTMQDSLWYSVLLLLCFSPPTCFALDGIFSYTSGSASFVQQKSLHALCGLLSSLLKFVTIICTFSCSWLDFFVSLHLLFPGAFSAVMAIVLPILALGMGASIVVQDKLLKDSKWYIQWLLLIFSSILLLYSYWSSWGFYWFCLSFALVIIAMPMVMKGLIMAFLAVLPQLSWELIGVGMALVLVGVLALVQIRDMIPIKIVKSMIEFAKKRKYAHIGWFIVWIGFVLTAFLWPRPSMWRLFSVPLLLLFAPSLPDTESIPNPDHL